MNTVFRHLFAIMVFFAVSNALPVYAQDQDPCSPSEDEKWEIRLMPYAWMLSLDADATVNGLEGSVDLDFDDIIDDYLDFTVMGRVEFWKGKWGITFDGVYFDLSADKSFEGRHDRIDFDLDIDLELGMADLGLAYRLLEQRFGKNCKQKLTFEPYGGLRYVYLLEKFDLTSDFVLIDSRGRRLGKSEDWVEPFIGCRIIWDLNDKMAINVRADAGGFGIGSASRLIWNFAAGIDYKLTKKVSLNAGYKILDIDYSRGSGSDKFGVDGKLKGPVIGMTILF